MKRLGLLFLSSLGLTSLLAGCQRDDTAMNAKIDQMSADIKDIKAALAGGVKGARPGAPGGDQAQRPKPDPNAVYSVPVGDSPSLFGPRNAKITVVEAFDFA